MTEHEMTKLLAKIQLVDNRQVDRMVLSEWMDDAGDAMFEDAVEAVRQFRRERPDAWITPGHVLAGARRAKEARERIARRGRAIAPLQITLDRAEFERLTQAAIAKHRAERGVA